MEYNYFYVVSVVLWSITTFSLKLILRFKKSLESRNVIVLTRFTVVYSANKYLSSPAYSVQSSGLVTKVRGVPDTGTDTEGLPNASNKKSMFAFWSQ